MNSCLLTELWHFNECMSWFFKIHFQKPSNINLEGSFFHSKIKLSFYSPSFRALAPVADLSLAISSSFSSSTTPLASPLKVLLPAVETYTPFFLKKKPPKHNHMQSNQIKPYFWKGSAFKTTVLISCIPSKPAMDRFSCMSIRVWKKIFKCYSGFIFILFFGWPVWLMISGSHLADILECRSLEPVVPLCPCCLNSYSIIIISVCTSLQTCQCALSNVPWL